MTIFITVLAYNHHFTLNHCKLQYDPEPKGYSKLNIENTPLNNYIRNPPIHEILLKMLINKNFRLLNNMYKIYNKSAVYFHSKIIKDF